MQQRSLTAGLLIFLVLIVLFYAPFSLIMAILVLVLGACGFEWLTLIPLSKVNAWWFIPLLVLDFYFSRFYFSVYQFLGTITLGLLFIAILFYPSLQKYWGKRIIVALCGLILLPLCFAAIANILQYKQGSLYLFYLLLLIWATDTGGYLVGQRMGSHKIIPKVSPGKTLEGTLGGVCAAICVGSLAFFYFHPYSARLWFVQMLATIMLALVGDLIISMFKRRVNCKDTGAILPGHGGILDRLDSLIAAAPIFYVLSQVYA
ncbi:MAG: hypothetical protein A3F18_08590 [Legionellales bacterium RIFCSPHIGHO2_12_FULL_37_14]|nr:MAG: hypothetical protein A3F18_08590 [Legionellales bacterium RIFCSPHIGHO2_12_FULL_37_14]